MDKITEDTRVLWWMIFGVASMAISFTKHRWFWFDIPLWVWISGTTQLLERLQKE